MSLRSYLFYLIGGLIILLTITQLLLINWLEQNLAKEVDNKARLLSEQVIELALDEFDHNKQVHLKLNKLANGTKVKIEHAPEQKHILIQQKPQLKNQIPVDHNQFTIVTDSSDVTPKIEVFTDSVSESDRKKSDNTEQTATQERRHQIIDHHQLSDELKNIVNKIHQDNSFAFSDIDDVSVFIRSPKIIQEHTVRRLPISHDTKKLMKDIQWILIIGCLIALALAYWLSNQFNKPLKQLSLGFKALAKGDYSYRVKAGGVKELRETIQHFNSTVSHLEQLTQAAKQHSEIAHLAELGEVSRGLAHALRNPIHTIGLSIEQLLTDKLTDTEKKRMIETMQNKMMAIDKSINALLALTTTGIKRNEQVPILAVVQDIILEYKLCQSKHQQFEISIDNKLAIMGAESEIRSILHTLIYNACEANPVDAKVQITAQQHQDKTTSINIIDQGPGLESSVQQQLFQPHISTKPEGAGMGLYIAQRIISLHYQGKISLTNNQNHGCCAQAKFYIKESL